MNIQVRYRPTSVVLIGVFLIIMSVSTLLSGLTDIFFTYEYNISTDSNDTIRNSLPDSEITLVPEPYASLFYMSSFIIAIFQLVASIQFFRLKSFARLTLEIVEWLSIFLISIFLIPLVTVWSDKVYSYVEFRMGRELDRLTIDFVNATIILIWVISVTISSVIILYLRSEKVRNAMTKA